MNTIDLSVVLNDQTPAYPGDPITEVKMTATVEDDGYADSLIKIGTHTGTHLDAPFHMIPGGKKLIDVPVSQFVGRGVYIKLENKVFNLETVTSAGIQEGDIVLFHTGMSDKYHDPEYYEDYPSIPDNIVEYLIEQKIRMVGVDTCSVDHELFSAHKALLGAGILIIENLTNLAELDGKRFEIIALPMKLENDGAPARVIARYN